MTAKQKWADDLRALDQGAWPEFLDRHSGLPGPRGNLELAAAIAELADDALGEELVNSDDEYRRFCGTLILGRRAPDPAVVSRLRGLATDERWRVREAVAIALQGLGGADFPALARIVTDWAGDADPLIQRAAVAAICEPRLLSTPPAAAVAVEACQRATVSLSARPPTTPRDADARVLRKALGYCWSVAIAADPGPGLVAFASLDSDYADLAWIIRENRSKKRLARLL
ncbi:MAG: HEAT repeat domain-containing protein [Candidatus Nanopelagicales bacterium]